MVSICTQFVQTIREVIFNCLMTVEQTDFLQKVAFARILEQIRHELSSSLA